MNRSWIFFPKTPGTFDSHSFGGRSQTRSHDSNASVAEAAGTNGKSEPANRVLLKVGYKNQSPKLNILFLPLALEPYSQSSSR